MYFISGYFFGTDRIFQFSAFDNRFILLEYSFRLTELSAGYALILSTGPKTMILKFFSSRPVHPLGDPKELKRVLADLPEEAFKAVSEIYGWFESLRMADDFHLDQMFDVVSRLDEAGQPYLRSLLHEYLETSHLSKSDERRLWAMCFNYWGEVASLYGYCIERLRKNPKGRGVEGFKGKLPLAATRLLTARSNQLKWVEYRYGSVGEDLWRGIGRPYLEAEAEKYAQKLVQGYPGASRTTSVAQQYLHALVRSSSSMGALLPIEIELADQLIAHLLPGFVLSEKCLPGNVYWVDAAAGSPPTRLAKPPPLPLPSLRFLLPGTVPQTLSELIHSVERGVIPTNLNLGGEYSEVMLLKVLQHLSLYWSEVPPQREHVRHAVKTRISVLQGFNDCLTVFAGNVARLNTERSAESWVVENVSLGGFCAEVKEIGDWLQIGVLLCIQPEGGKNWMLGMVRRCSVTPNKRASIGIQTLSREAQSIELSPQTSGFLVAEAIPGILLCGEGDSGEIRVVMPKGSFDVRVNQEYSLGEKRFFLTPLALDETGSNFEIGRYREQLVSGGAPN